MKAYVKSVLSIIVFLVGITSVSIGTTSAASNSVTIFVDGKKMTYSSVLQKSVPMVPLKLISKSLNIKFEYNKTYNLYVDNNVYSFAVNNSAIFVNGTQKYTIDDKPFIKNGTFYIPYYFLKEIIGFGVTYDQKQKTLKFSSKRSIPNQNPNQLPIGEISLSDLKYGPAVYLENQEYWNFSYLIHNQLYVNPDSLIYLLGFDYDYKFDKAKNEYALKKTNQLLVINKQNVTFNSQVISDEGIITLRGKNGAIDSTFVKLVPILTAFKHQITIGKQRIDITLKKPSVASIDMLLAIRDNNAAAVKQLLQNGADPNAIDANGDPLLYTVVNKKELFFLLLDYGADPSVRIKKLNNQSLILFVNDLESFKYLLSKGADPNAFNLFQSILFKQATRYQFEFVVALLEANGDVNEVDLDGNNALLALLSKNNIMFNDKIEELQLKTIKALIDHHINLGLKNKTGATALSLAVSNNFSENVISLLKQSGAK